MGGRVWDAGVGWFRRVEEGKGDKIGEKDAVMEGPEEEDNAEGEAEEEGHHGRDAKTSGTNGETRVVHLKQAVEYLHSGVLALSDDGEVKDHRIRQANEMMNEASMFLSGKGLGI